MATKTKKKITTLQVCDACVGGDSSVPLGFVSLSENLFMIAGALIMLFL